MTVDWSGSLGSLLGVGHIIVKFNPYETLDLRNKVAKIELVYLHWVSDTDVGNRDLTI